MANLFGKRAGAARWRRLGLQPCTVMRWSGCKTLVLRSRRHGAYPAPRRAEEEEAGRLGSDAGGGCSLLLGVFFLAGEGKGIPQPSSLPFSPA